MKGSIIITGFFVSGIFIGLQGWLPESITSGDFSSYALYILMFLVGFSVAGDPKTGEILRGLRPRLLLIPLFGVTGTFAGSLLYVLFFDSPSMRDTLAIAAGFGYYSLSSVLIGEISGEASGVIALLANLMREIFTLLMAPLLAAWFGALAPLMAAGATASDTTLPVIVRYSGKEYSIVAILSGILLTILVPFIISLIYSL